MKVKKLLDSFNNAIEGIIYAVRTQRNLKIHLVLTLVVLIACFFYNVSKIELLILIITITMVIVTELINTGIEFAIDSTTNYYHPLAKIAKNVAAGAVLISTINAVMVGYIIFWDKLKTINFGLSKIIKNSNPYMVFIILIIVCITTLIVKAVFGEGTPFKGGMPSGHSAIAFCIATIIALLTEKPVSVALSYLLALIVAQSRVDSEVHSTYEVFVGAILGTLLTILIYKIFM